eukprot:SAG11_NODE_534_length_8654_cov_11.580919_1_plen_1130_part_10
MNKTLGIVDTFADPADKRSNGLAEHSVLQLEKGVKAMMFAVRAPVEAWECMADAKALMLNCFPTQKDVKGKSGDAARPLEKLSMGEISREMCDTIIHHFITPHTPCLVTDPRTKGSTLEPRCRWCIAYKMLGDMPVFKCMRTGAWVRSKSYIVFDLMDGQNAYHFLGLTPPALPKSVCVRPSDRDEPDSYVVELEGLYEPSVMKKNPVIRTVHEHGAAHPNTRVHVVDRDESTGLLRVFETDSDGVLRPSGEYLKEVSTDVPISVLDESDLSSEPEAEPSSEPEAAASSAPSSEPETEVSIIPSRTTDSDESLLRRLTRSASGKIQLSTEKATVPPTEVDVLRLQMDPESFVGHKIYRHFTIEETAPHSPGVYMGEVVRTHQSATGETLWEVEYEADGHRQFLDSEEMSNFGIMMIHGSVETRENITSATVGVDPLSMQDYDIYHTKAGDTFVDVCKAVGVVDTNRKYYYDWMCQFHDYGARGCAYRFPSPFTSRGRLSGTAAVLEAGKAFPVPAGSQWEHILELHGVESARVNPSWHSAQAVRIGLASAEMNVALHRLADRSPENDAVNYSQTVVENNGGGRLSEEARTAMSSDLVTVSETCGVHSAAEPEAEGQSAVDERIAQLENECDDWRECHNPWKSRHFQDLVRNNEYLRNGKIVPPSDMAKAKLRSDRDLWIYAAEVELAALDRLQVFEHELTHNEIRSKGVRAKPVPLIFVLTVKYDLDTGSFIKCKARLCLQGCPAFMQKGRHFFQTHASTPDPTTSRLLCALLVGRHMHRIVFDVANAFPTTECAEYEKIACMYPKGMERWRAPDGSVSETKAGGAVMLMLFLVRVLYGSPAAPRRFAKARDAWVLEHFNSNGWKCVQCRSDPCLMRMTSPAGGICLVCTHVDDVEAVCDVEADCYYIHDAYHRHFQNGVVTCDPELLLGVRRVRTRTADGVDMIDLSQPEFIDTLYRMYADDDDMPSGDVDEPAVPHLHLDLGGDSIRGKQFLPPSVQESAAIIDKGYRSVCGSLLWIAGRTCPEVSGTVSMLCKVMSRPSRRAWQAALQCLAYVWRFKRQHGIRFRSDGNKSPEAAYDSSNKWDVKDAKAQYGFAIHLFDGPVIWTSKKHSHVGTSSTHNEYMALYWL